MELSAQNPVISKGGRPRKTAPVAVSEGKPLTTATKTPKTEAMGIDPGRVFGFFFAIYAVAGTFKIIREIKKNSEEGAAA